MLLIIVLILCLGIQTKQTEEKVYINRPRFLSQGREILVRKGTDLELFCEDLGEFVILWKFNRT